MIAPRRFILRPAVLCLGLAGCPFPWFLLVVSLAAGEPRTDRLTGTFEGIECEYSPGQEDLARALAVRFGRHNHQIGSAQTARVATRIEALSPEEMRTNRTAYLGRIAALLALEKPTALQEDVYDAFLANYEETMLLYDGMRTGFRSLQIIKRVAVWDRPELVRRMESGEKVAGLTYDPATKSGSVSYGEQLELGSGINARFQALAAARQQLKFTSSLNFETKDGLTTYRARVDLSKKQGKSATASAPASGATPPAGGVTQWFPVIVPADLPPEAADKRAERLWTGMGDASLEKIMGYLARALDSLPAVDQQIAFLVLHETTEIGIVDHYLHGRDRRWFCDGMANYGAWRVLCDLHGEGLATQVHNLPAQLKSFSDLRQQADLCQWPAAESESAEQARSRLESARYAFAERAVALMEERGGKDVLPRLFAEIGRTKPDKVSIKTVNQAWQKLTGTKLDTILADAVKPLPGSLGPQDSAK